MAPRRGIPLEEIGVGGMAQAEKQRWCKLCNKSFPSYCSLGGHMNLHITRRRKKKPPPSPRKAPPITGASGSRYDFRERRRQRPVAPQSQPDHASSDDEPWTLAPKTECQLCFKAFHSCDALSMHMKAHGHHGRKMVMVEQRASRKTSSANFCGVDDGDHGFAAVSYAHCKRARSKRIRMDVFPAPVVVVTHGTEVEDAACILVMLSKDAYKGSDSLDEDPQMDGSLECGPQKTEMEPSSYRLGVTGDTELIKPENSSSYEEIKFGSLSNVVKATAIHECRLCGKVLASGSALGGYMKSHSVPAHKKVATFPKTSVTPSRKQLLEVQNELHELNLPALSNRDCSSTRTESELNPWWVASSIQSERMMGVRSIKMKHDKLWDLTNFPETPPSSMPHGSDGARWRPVPHEAPPLPLPRLRREDGQEKRRRWPFRSIARGVKLIVPAPAPALALARGNVRDQEHLVASRAVTRRGRTRGHAVVDQHEAVAVVGDVDRGHVAVGQGGPAPRVVDVAGDGAAAAAGWRGGGAGEELRGVEEVVEVEEDAGEGEREEVLAEAVVDGRAPRQDPISWKPKLVIAAVARRRHVETREGGLRVGAAGRGGAGEGLKLPGSGCSAMKMLFAEWSRRHHRWRGLRDRRQWRSHTRGRLCGCCAMSRLRARLSRMRRGQRELQASRQWQHRHGEAGHETG
uniref:C2H2-type domain-containing protein n=1 Tax=Oryza glumipatula TaxID=40148 RepID=A0A0D9ZAC8_9ORYZ